MNISATEQDNFVKLEDLPHVFCYFRSKLALVDSGEIQSKNCQLMIETLYECC